MGWTSGSAPAERGGCQYLVFTTSASEKFQKLVAPFVHPSMAYKLLPRFRGQFAVKPEFVEPVIRPVPAQVLDVSRQAGLSRSMSRYDIEVEGSHNYFADGSHGPQQPRDDHGREGTEVLCV